jgi:hypothetical protein
VNAGYSGTPLAKKLGFKPGQRAWIEAMPDGVADEIGDIGIIMLPAPEAPIDAAHIFVTARAMLADRLAMLMPLLAPSGFVWVSWPKKASKVPTDITEDVIRHICLPMQLVDVKVCAVDTIWSGLKLMIRRSAR